MIRNAYYLFLPYFIYTDGGKSALRFGILEGDTHISRDSGIPYFLIFFDISGPFLPRMPCAFISLLFQSSVDLPSPNWRNDIKQPNNLEENSYFTRDASLVFFIYIHFKYVSEKKRKNYINGIEKNSSLQKSKRMYGKEERAINKHIIRSLSDGWDRGWFRAWRHADRMTAISQSDRSHILIHSVSQRTM